MSTQLTVKADAHVMSPVPCRILSVEQELQDTYTLEIEPPGDEWGFLPGQYTMLYAFGIGEVPISISGDPDDSTKIVQTIRAVGAVTDALVALQMATNLNLGDMTISTQAVNPLDVAEILRMLGMPTK